MTAIHLPVISAITAGVLIIIQMLLMLATAFTRRRTRQSLGDGGDATMLRAVRRHGNFAENAALFVAGFALFEMLGGLPQVVAAMCAIFVVGRISHIIALSQTNTLGPLRFGAVISTAGVGFFLGVRLILLAAPLIHVPF